MLQAIKEFFEDFKKPEPPEFENPYYIKRCSNPGCGEICGCTFRSFDRKKGFSYACSSGCHSRIMELREDIPEIKAEPDGLALPQSYASYIH